MSERNAWLEPSRAPDYNAGARRCADVCACSSHAALTTVATEDSSHWDSFDDRQDDRWFGRCALVGSSGGASGGAVARAQSESARRGVRAAGLGHRADRYAVRGDGRGCQSLSILRARQRGVDARRRDPAHQPVVHAWVRERLVARCRSAALPSRRWCARRSHRRLALGVQPSRRRPQRSARGRVPLPRRQLARAVARC